MILFMLTMYPIGSEICNKNKIMQKILNVIANNAIGPLVLRFEDKDQMEYAVTHQSEWLKVVVK